MKNKKMTKKILTGVCALAFSLSVAAGISLAETKASADNATLQAQASTFAIKEGAAVRITDPYGIRYTATISKDNYDTIASSYESVEYGVLICPTDLLAGKTLDFDTRDGLVPGNAAAGEIEFGYVKATPILDEKTNVYTLKGSLVGIKEENLSRPFTGKAYIKATDAEGNVSYAYTSDESRAIYTVATYAVNDPDETEKAKLDAVVEGVAQTPRAYLESVINKVQTVYGNPEITVTSSNAETAEYNILNGGDKITVSGKVSKTVGDVTRTLDACPTITADASSGITLEQTSPTEYIVRGTNKTGFNLNATIGTGDNKLSAQAFEEEVTSWSNKITASELGEAWQGGPVGVLTPVEDKEGDLVGAYEWTNSKYLGIQPSVTSTFEVGDRLVFDVYATDGMLISLNYNGSNDQFLWLIGGGKNETITVNGEDLYSFRIIDTETNELITNGTGNYKKHWLTFEITILKKSDSRFTIMYYETDSCKLADGVYVRNLDVLKYSTKTEVALADGVVIDQEKTYDFLTPINIGNIEVTDDRGVTKTLPASATGGYVEDGILYTGLGTQNIVINAEGYDGGLEYTINGPASATILDGQETLSNVVFGNNFKMTYEESYKGNQNAWLTDNNGKDCKDTDEQAVNSTTPVNEGSDGFTFTNKVAANVKKDTYLYMEVYAASQFYLTAAVNSQKKGGYVKLLYYYVDGSDGVTYYDATGAMCTRINGATASGIGMNVAYREQWITIALKITEDWNNAYSSISCYSGQFEASKGLRFGKIWLSNEAVTTPVIELVEEAPITEVSLLGNSEYVSTGSKSTMTLQTEGEFAGAYQWTVAPKVTGDGNSDRACAILSAAAVGEFAKQGNYMYISFYQTTGTTFALMASGKANFLYNANATGGNNVAIKRYAYQDGAPVNVTDKALSGYTNQWVTYELYFEADITNTSFYFFLYLDPSTTEYEMYVKDLKWCATQQEAFANAA